MKQVCALASKASLVMLLMCAVMLFIVEVGTAEWVVTVLSVIMMSILFAVSTLLLRKKDKKEEEPT